MLTGYTTPFHKQPVHIRQSIIQGWRLSYLPPLNLVFKQMTLLGKNMFLKTSTTFHKVCGFKPWPENYRPGPGYEYEFQQFGIGAEPEVIETDVVIVGSGCGGAVAAKNLAEAGHRVLVVDKSYYHPPSQYPMTEAEGGIHLFENGGVETTDDSSISIILGSSWGGGGTVNVSSPKPISLLSF